MEKKGRVCAFVLVLCTIVLIITISVGVGAKAGDDQDNLRVEEEAGAARSEEEEEMRGRGWVEEALVDAISVFTVTSAAPPCATPATSYYWWYWEEVRSRVVGVLAYLFPPKIDFRPGKPDEDGGGNGNENVKEALSKSFDQGKQIVEDSAKAAADIAGEL